MVARAGHRSGKIAVVVSGLLLLATIVATLLFNGEAWPASPGWIGVAVAAVVAVLVLAWVLSRRIAVVVSGLVLLATLAFSAWQTGGWINVAVIAVMAVVAVLVFVWVRSRNKPPPPVGWERVKTSRGSSRGSAHPEPGGRPNHRPA